MNSVVFLVVLIMVSFALAKLEIAIEGKDGWAGKLPTWRLPANHWVSRLFFGGKPATGYHVWLDIFLFSFLHVIYVFVPFSVSRELALVSFLFLLWVLEDFFWFALNPAFGLKNFKKEKISWHSAVWWWFAPRDYFILAPLGLILYVLSLLIKF